MPTSSRRCQQRTHLVEVDRRTFGAELVNMLGGKVLTNLASHGKLIPFLEKKSYKGRPLIELLGGWMKSPSPRA